MKAINRKQTSNVSISLPNDMKSDVEKLAIKQDTTFSQLVKQALRSYLIEQKLDEIQTVLRPAFQKLGIKTDEDIQKFFG